ncbi:MAG: amidohydrolase family protein [Clostridia bacterium]|nr:amidohydrolase family protein [Clostridia bacterium]
MIIDFHTHTFPDKIASAAIEKLKSKSHTKAFTSGTDSELLASMASCGIDKSVILPVATNPEKIPHINDISAEKNRHGNLIYFAAMHPDFADAKEELRRIRSLGIKGIKLHPVYQDIDFDDIRTLRVLEFAEENGLITVVHAGLDVGFPGVERCTPKMIKNAVSAVSPKKLVLAHMGSWKMWQEAKELLSGRGLFIDTSFSIGKMTQETQYYSDEELSLLNPCEAASVIDAFGEDNVLFGTDSPWGDQKADIENILKLPIDNESKEKIMYKNAAKLLEI